MLLDLNGNKLSTVTKYGIIQDVHENPEMVKNALEVFKKAEIDKILVNGDIVNHAQTSEEAMRYTAHILDMIGKTNLETYVQPGSHETVREFMPVIDILSKKYPNLISTLEVNEVKGKDHWLYFIPGSDSVAGGEYTFTAQKDFQRDLYFQTKEGLVSASKIDESKITKEQLAQLQQLPLLYVTNINDLESKIKEPEKSVMICHVPRKFDDVNVGVDRAYFGSSFNDGGIYPGKYFHEDAIELFGDDNVDMKKFARKLGYDLKNENSGNKELKKLYESTGIKKAVSGHFHESGHRAHDENENPVKEGEMVNELFWNAGYLDEGQTGILTVKENKVSYQNINLK